VAITVTNAETARAINREIQWLRKNRGPGVELHDGTTAHVGDQIATRRNTPDLRTTIGERVRNRHTWTVTATRPDGSLTVTHPDRGTVDLPARYVAAHVELGWAVTGYGTQGDTVDVGIAVLDTTTSRNHAYVALTRGRHANHALLLDSTGTEEPTELLGRIIARPAHGESALAVQDQLHQAHGLEPPDPAEATSPEPARTSPSTRPLPKEPAFVEPTLEDKVRAAQQRLDQLQQRATERTPDRSLGL
jgi:hypothetical protein